MDGMKKCSRCKKIKSHDEYYRSTNSKDGFNSTCNNCRPLKYENKCLSCNKLFKTSYPTTKFCSRECRIFQHICVNCNKPFSSKVSVSKYCSQECRETFVLELKEIKCNKCGITKSVEEFWTDRNTPTNKRGYCKECGIKTISQKNREKKLKKYMDSIGIKEVERKIPSEINLEDLKHCGNCNQKKPLKEFEYRYTEKRFRSQCKECRTVKNRNNREKRELKKYKEIRERSKNNGL